MLRNVVAHLPRHPRRRQPRASCSPSSREPFDGAFSVNGDEGRLGQVLTNLIDNAISFSPEGGTVTVRARSAAPFVEIIVEDEGPGIPEDRLEIIFDRFYTDRPATDASRGKNSGLGLSASRARSCVARRRDRRREPLRRRRRAGASRAAPASSCGCRSRARRSAEERRVDDAAENRARHGHRARGERRADPRRLRSGQVRPRPALPRARTVARSSPAPASSSPTIGCCSTRSGDRLQRRGAGDDPRQARGARDRHRRGAVCARAPSSRSSSTSSRQARSSACPSRRRYASILGSALPVLRLAPFEASAPIKLLLALARRKRRAEAAVKDDSRIPLRCGRTLVNSAAPPDGTLPLGRRPAKPQSAIPTVKPALRRGTGKRRDRL